MAKTATLNLRIDADLKAEFTKLAEQEDRSTSYLVEQAMRERLAYEQAKVRAIEIALGEADRGKLIPHDDVKAWVESWDTDNELPMPTSKTAKA